MFSNYLGIIRNVSRGLALDGYPSLGHISFIITYTLVYYWKE